MATAATQSRWRACTQLRRIEIYLPIDIASRLDALTKGREKSRAKVIEGLINTAANTKRLSMQEFTPAREDMTLDTDEKRLNVRMPKDELRALKQYALRHDMHLSELVREALDAYKASQCSQNNAQTQQQLAPTNGSLTLETDNHDAVSHDSTAANRQRAYKSRQRAQGLRQLTVWVRNDEQTEAIRRYLDQAEPLQSENERLCAEVARLTAELEAERQRRRELAIHIANIKDY